MNHSLLERLLDINSETRELIGQRPTEALIDKVLTETINELEENFVVISKDKLLSLLKVETRPHFLESYGTKHPFKIDEARLHVSSSIIYGESYEDQVFKESARDNVIEKLIEHLESPYIKEEG